MVHWHSNRYLKCLKPSISPPLGRCHYCRFDSHTEIMGIPPLSDGTKFLFKKKRKEKQCREVDLCFSSLWEEMKTCWVETTNMLVILVSVYASTSCDGFNMYV